MEIYRRQRVSQKVISQVVRTRYKFKFVAFGLILLGLLLFFAGAYTHKNIIKREHISQLGFIFKGIESDIKSNLPGSHRAPNLVFDINFQNMKILERTRQRNIELQAGIYKEFDWVPAKLRFNNKIIKAKVRLKGTAGDHWLDKDSLSFRVNIDGDNSILGAKRLTVQPPERRSYLSEWLFMEALKREGMIFHRLELMNVIVNGDKKGIWAIQEQYGKELIENNGRREGPIVGFDKDLQFLTESRDKGRRINHPDTFWQAPVTSSQPNKYIFGSEQYNFRLTAFELLEEFRQGRRTVKEVFDVEQLALLFALRALFGSGDLDWRDIRFYFNPITNKLEPIGRETASAQLSSKRESMLRNNWWLPYLSKDSPFEFHDNIYKSRTGFFELIYRSEFFLEKYIEALGRFSQQNYLKSLFDEVGEELLQKEALMRYTSDYVFDSSVIYANQETIRFYLNPVQLVHAYLVRIVGEELLITVGNLQSFPVEIIGSKYKGVSLEALDRNVILPGKQPGQPVNYSAIRFQLSKNQLFSESDLTSFQLIHKILGDKRSREMEISKSKFIGLGSPYVDIVRMSPNAEELSFIKTDHKKKEYVIQSGEWDLTKNVLFEGGYVVRAEPGTKLILSNGASIISYSPIEFVGTKTQPILIDAKSPNSGLVVMQTSGMSYLENVTFSGLGTPANGSWMPSGAVTFYEANVSIKNCFFFRNRRGDDFLNIIRSKFDIETSMFSNALMDAIDLDFSSGVIRKTKFINIGNDGIDTSGTDVSIRKVSFKNIGDKSISAGENSSIHIEEIFINHSTIGIASKDLSQVIGSNIDIQNSKYQLIAYQKKPEYGPATIRLKNVTINDSRNILVENRSEILINGVAVSEKIDNVEDILNSGHHLGTTKELRLLVDVPKVRGNGGKRWVGKSKAEVVVDILEKNTTIAEVAQQYGLSPIEIERWVTQAIDSIEVSFRSSPADTDNQKTPKLNDANGLELETSLDTRILKKLTGLFRAEERPHQ